MVKSILLAILVTLPASGVQTSTPAVPSDADRARWTMADMTSWSIVLQAYHLDNARFPAVKDFNALVAAVQPIYIRVAPQHDAWGTPYRYDVSEDGTRSWLVSAGADRQFEKAQSPRLAELEDFSQDAAVVNGRFLRTWEIR